MKGKITKKIAKVLLWVIGIFIALDLLIVGLFFVPSIQNFVVHKVTSLISEQWGAEIGIGRIYVTPTLRLAADDVVIKDMKNNPMIYVKNVKGHFRKLGLQPLTLHFFDIVASEADVQLVIYEGDSIVNISEWAQHIAKPKKEPAGFILRSDHIKLINSHFSIANQNIQQKTPYIDGQEFDPGFYEIRHIDFNANDFQVFNDDISAKIKQLGFDQYFGFHLLKGSGDFDINGHGLRFDNCKLQTENSNLDLDLRFDYSDWSRLGDFLDSVQITADIRPSEFCMTDAACYAGAIRGMDSRFKIQGKVSGCVNDMHLSDFTCHLGEQTYFNGNFSLKSVTDIANVSWDMNFDEANFNMADLSKFTLPAGQTLVLPDMVQSLGDVQLQGSTSGYLPAINTDLNIFTNLGCLKAEFASDDNGSNIFYTGNLTSYDFNLGKLIKNTKDFGQAHFSIDLDGTINKPEYDTNYLASLETHITSQISRLDLLGYPISNIYLNGDFQDKLCDFNLSSDDKNLDMNLHGLLNFSLLKPNIQAYFSCNNIEFSKIVANYPAIDSAKAQGFDKFIYYAQSHEDVDLALDSLSLNICGSDLYDINGYVGIDGLKIKSFNQPLVSDRIRCTAINTASGLHKIILSSNFVNATLNTNYQYDDIADSLINYAYKFIPNLLPPRAITAKQKVKSVNNDDKHFDLYVETFDVQPILDIFFPELSVDEHCLADIHIDESTQNDKILVQIPNASFQNNYFVHNLNMSIKSNKNKNLFIDLSSDSISVANDGPSLISIHDLALKTEVKQSFIDYQLSWKDIPDTARDHSQITGTFDMKDKKDLIAKITDSKILLDEYTFHFNNLNSIHIQGNRILVDNLIFGSEDSYLEVNGAFSEKENDNLNIDVSNIDISLVNNFLQGISFDGNLSANADIMTRNGNRIVIGKVMAADFKFNESDFGNVFLTAGMGENGSMGFSGGIFQSEGPISSSIIKEYSIKDYQTEKNKLANINGYYRSKDKLLVAKANIGKLDISFLNTFLSSFSDNIQGTASGELSFISSRDSSYIQGIAHVEEMTMGITPLGTMYFIKNQDIQFDHRGIIFNKIALTDKENNNAVLDGHIYHNLFQDMKIHLNINTPRLMALNLPKSPNGSFYGTGFVSGDIQIIGDDKGLDFKSNNLTTLKGSSIVFPITSSQSVSENTNIRFKTILQDSVFVAPTKETSTKLNFDFNFNVTPDAEVQVDVFAIGGTMRGKTAGRLHLLYEDGADVNIFGDLEIRSGTFLLSLEDIINTKLQLVEGGKVSFNGPVADFDVNISAYYTNKASLSNVITDNTSNVSRVPVNAYIHLNGKLMKYPSMNFSFELPNSSQEIRNRFFMAIDTTNPQNKTKQFFIFLLTNQFMPDNASNADISNSFENGGTGLVTNMINNFISRQMKHGGLGFVYKSDKQKSSSEYGINANMQFLDDRLILETTIGYYYNSPSNSSSAQQGFNNFYGDFSLEYLITQKGNWRVKVYNFNDTYGAQTSKRIPGVGLALLYKQDFNTKKDFKDDFTQEKIEKKSKTDKKAKKNNK